MAEFSNEQIGAALIAKNPRALDYYMQYYSEPHYSFCLNLCLEQPKHASVLFEKTLETAFDNAKTAELPLDIWFYRHMHEIWSGLVRSRRELQAQAKKDMEFDWKRKVGAQQTEALKILTPFEREIILYRFSSKFIMPKILQVTGYTPERTMELFNAALQRITGL